MSDLRSGRLLDHNVIDALNTQIGETLKSRMGQEAALPENLQRLMAALAKAD